MGITVLQRWGQRPAETMIDVASALNPTTGRKDRDLWEHRTDNPLPTLFTRDSLT